MEVAIRQAVLDHHEARIQATKIGPEKVFYYLHLLKQVPFFGECSLSEDDLKQLVLELDITQYEDGAVIIQEGTVPKDCYLLESGAAEVVKEGMNLDVQYGHAAFFGELGLKTNENRTASVIAKGATRCIRISKVAFRKVLLSGSGAHKDLHKRQMQYQIQNNAHDKAAEGKAQPSPPGSPRSSSRVLSAQQVDEELAGDEEDDQHFHVTRATVTAIRTGIINHSTMMPESEVNGTVHQGIWGLEGEHHSLKKRWSRRLQNHKTVAENGEPIYEGEVEVPIPEFMDNLRKCVAETFGPSLKIDVDDGSVPLPASWTKMSVVDKVNGVPVEMPDNFEGSPTVWIGGIPEAHAHSPEHLKKELAWFGGLQSLTVRVKPGYNKSWALVTFVESESAEIMLGRSGKKFLIMHAEKGWSSLIFKKSAGTKELAKGKKGALASILAGQRLKNADAGARTGWHGPEASAERKEQARQKAEALAKERGKITKESADYLLRKKHWSPKPPGEHTPIDPHQHYGGSPDAKKTHGGSEQEKAEKDGSDSEDQNGTLGTAIRLDEFQEELSYVPGGGYYWKSDTQGCKTHGGGPPITTVDPPPTGGHPRPSSVNIPPMTDRSVLNENDAPEVAIDPRARAHSGPPHAMPVVGPAAVGWIPKPHEKKPKVTVEEVALKEDGPITHAAPQGAVVTTHSHRGIASGMFAVAVAKDAAHTWQEAVAGGKAGVDMHYVTGMEAGLVQRAVKLRPSSARPVGSAPATATAARPQSAAPAAASPRAQKQAAVADGSSAGSPLTSPAWKPMNLKKCMNAGWRHKHAQRPRTAPARPQSPKGVTPPSSPPRAGGKRYARARPAPAPGQGPMQFVGGWDNPAKRF